LRYAITPFKVYYRFHIIIICLSVILFGFIDSPYYDNLNRWSLFFIGAIGLSIHYLINYLIFQYHPDKYTIEDNKLYIYSSFGFFKNKIGLTILELSGNIKIKTYLYNDHEYMKGIWKSLSIDVSDFGNIGIMYGNKTVKLMWIDNIHYMIEELNKLK